MLFVAVLAVVLLFLFWGYSLVGDREERLHQDVYHFVITDDFCGEDFSVWLNDSLIASHAHAGDTITHPRLADETSILVVDNATDRVVVIPVTPRSGVVPLRRPTETE